MKYKNVKYGILLTREQFDFLKDDNQGFHRMKAFDTFLSLTAIEPFHYEKKNFSAYLGIGQFAISKVELAGLWHCDRKTAQKMIDLFNEVGILTSIANNRTTIHTIHCLAFWFVDGQNAPIKNPNYHRNPVASNLAVQGNANPMSANGNGNSHSQSLTSNNPVSSVADANNDERGKNTLSGCYKLTSIKIGDGVKSLSGYTFNGCGSCSPSGMITSLVLGKGLTEIGFHAFFGCCIDSLSIPDNVTSLDDLAFNGGSIRSVVIGSGIKSLVSTFENHDHLTSVTIGDGVTSIGQSAFNGCWSLPSITIPGNVTSIGELAFRHCANLETVTIGSGVETIGEFAFEGCKSLTSITIPDNVTSIGEFAFVECYNNDKYMNNRVYEGLTSVYCLAKEAPSGIENAIDMLSEITLYVPVGALESYQKAEANGYKKFKNIKEFFKEDATTYTIDESNTIAIEVVEPKEETVEIPNSMTIDGETYPVAAIAANAFEGNTVIKQVSIPETIEEIGDAAFSGCSDLSTIYCYAKEPIVLGSNNAKVLTRAVDDESTASSVFAGVDKVACVLYVPAGSISKYKSANGWREFEHIVEMITGDANEDGKVDVADIVIIANYLKGQETPGFNEKLADADHSGKVTEDDLESVARIILTQ